VGLVRADRVEHPDPLGLVLGDALVVGAVRGDPELAQPAGEASDESAFFTGASQIPASRLMSAWYRENSSSDTGRAVEV
jgi:hypothetical protein